MTNIKLFTGEGLFSPDHLFNFCSQIVVLARKNRSFILENTLPRHLLFELFIYLKSRNELPDLDVRRKNEIWIESGKDKILAYSLYLIEVI